MPTPQISLPFPTQIASGQALSAAPVKSDLDHIASQYNTHTHDGSEITGAAPFLPIGGICLYPGPTSGQTNLWYCDGATFLVSSYAALATACGTWHGGNASIGKVPDMRGRVPVDMALSGGHSRVATMGNNDGAILADRQPVHKHDARHQLNANTAGGGGNAGAPATSYTSDLTSNMVDTPAYYVMNFLIRAF